MCQSREVTIACENAALAGALTIPPNPRGLVIFAHGSGSSRHSPRNRFVASRLQARGLATLLMDLLTEAESANRANVFDIPLLGSRVEQVAEWAQTDTETARLPIGLFGASTGAAAAIVAAARLGSVVRSVVSRGGRPDLAADSLGELRSPTLLIVGSLDLQVLGLNEWAQSRMNCESEVVVIHGASHLFEEPGTLEQAADAAAVWFLTHAG